MEWPKKDTFSEIKECQPTFEEEEEDISEGATKYSRTPSGNILTDNVSRKIAIFTEGEKRELSYKI